MSKIIGTIKNNKNQAQFLDKGKNGSPYFWVKLSNINFA